MSNIVGIRSQIVAIVALLAVIVKLIFKLDIDPEMQKDIVAGLVALYFLFMADKLQRGVK